MADEGRHRAETAQLRESISSSGRWLVLRQLIGAFIAGASLFVVARRIGPDAYGIYSASFATWLLLQQTTELNLDVWLVTRKDASIEAHSGVVFTLLTVTGLAGFGLVIAAGPILQALSGLRVESCLRIMAPAILITNISQVGLSKLERSLNFRAIGVIEISGQACFAGFAIGASYAGLGATSLAVGLLAQQMVLGVCFLLVGDGYRFGWDKSLAVESIRFGSLATVSSLSVAAAFFLTPVMVGRYLGGAVLGQVSLALRLLDQASLARTVILRISYAVFARLAGRVREFSSAFSDGSMALLVGSGIPIIGLAAAAGPLFPPLFGPAWHSVPRFLALLSIPWLFTITAQLVQSALTARGLVRLTTYSGLASLAVYAASLPILLHTFGQSGLLLAQSLAAVPSVVLFWILVKLHPAIDWLSVLTVIVSLAIASQIPKFGWPCVLGLGSIILVPRSRLRFTRIWASVTARNSSFGKDSRAD